MDPLSSLLNADSALEPMLAMASECSSSNVSTIRALVMKVLTDPQIHCGFDQIKGSINESLSSNEEGQVMLRTLDLFSYGTYKEYAKAESGKYLSLTDAQVFKLRQLTVMTLVQNSCLQSENTGVVCYETLQQELELERVEDVVISCIYANLIFGKLCQKNRRLVVTSMNGPPCRARDVPMSQAGFLLSTLKTLSQRLDNTRSQLEASKLTVQGRKDQHEAFWKQTQKNSKMGPAGSTRSGSARSVKRSRGGMTPDSMGRL